MSFTFGCDPEFFLSNRRSSKLISAEGLVPGTKGKPFKLDGGAVQVDGMAVEINIDPVITPKGFVDNVSRVLSQVGAMLPDYDFHYTPTAHFDKDVFDNASKDALELGCEVDFNAYTGEPNPTPDSNTNFRTGAGHIHIGWTEGVDIKHPEHFEACREIVRNLDYYLGINSLLWDKDHKRRTLYGKAGSFRPTSYGVEYRTLSNAWLRSPKLMMWVANAAKLAVEDRVKGLCYYKCYGEAARVVIDECNENLLSNRLMWITNMGRQDDRLGIPPVVDYDLSILNKFLPKSQAIPKDLG